jgi:tRNA-splicing ligase RtcB
LYDIYNEKNGNLQLGTLGSGNHFIEIGVDEFNEIWIIIHSGSRGVGHGCAIYYMQLAHPNNKAGEGHYGFDVNSNEGKNYIKDLNFCLEYALLNRKIMLNLVDDAISDCGIQCYYDPKVLINRNHNHAETKDGKKWIHRKGATHAEKDMLGIIPGNMRDGSFIIKGLGNEDALCSSSHGAGRILGRKKAKKKLNLEEFSQTMEGIVANVSENTLDESPMAYKDIFKVMEFQKDLVKVLKHVKPILNVKGYLCQNVKNVEGPKDVGYQIKS